MTRTAFYVCAALVTVLCRAQNVSPDDIDALRNLLTAGAQIQARDAAEQLIERAVKQPTVLLELGQLLSIAKEFTLAERAFERAADAARGSFEAQFNLGLTRFQMQNTISALEPLEKASLLRPDSFDANYLLGVTLSESGRKLDAIRRLRIARRLRPGHLGVLSLLGVLYVEHGYSLDAMETLDAARRLDASRLAVWLALIEACHDAFEFQKALDWAVEAASRFPDSADAHFRLGFELEAAGRFEEARTALERALKLNPDHPETRLALGRAELRAGRRAIAVEHFEAVLRLQPTNTLARLELAKSLVGVREFARAKRLLLPLGAENTDPAPHLLLYQVFQAEGNAAESARHRARYLELTSVQNLGGMSGNLASRKLRRFVP